MSKRGFYQYYVEGEDEEKLLKVLKSDMGLIIPGKVHKFNVIQQRFTDARLMQLKQNTTVVLVFDTDTTNDTILKSNICQLNACPAVNSIICITQVLRIEDELIRSCNIKQIKELTGSKTNREFKHDFITDSNIVKRLIDHEFNINKLWMLNPSVGYRGITNEADKIKKH